MALARKVNRQNKFVVIFFHNLLSIFRLITLARKLNRHKINYLIELNIIELRVAISASNTFAETHCVGLLSRSARNEVTQTPGCYLRCLTRRAYGDVADTLADDGDRVLPGHPPRTVQGDGLVAGHFGSTARAFLLAKRRPATNGGVLILCKYLQ
jgi:hypothetical protein